MIKLELEQLIRGQDLTAEQVRSVFEQLTAGELTEPEIAGFLVALASKGPTAEELAAAAFVMRQRVTRVPISVEAIDTCGSGGDGVCTFNISTCAALIAAGAGAYVAKHGNRTNTRRSGSAEALTALGVNIDADIPTVVKCIEESHIGFLYAIKLHPSMKYAAPVRKALAIRTIFNLLGPLTNPAFVQRQIVGVPQPEETELVAGALKNLGARHAMVVHGLEGLCDLSISGPSKVSEVSAGVIRTYEVDPRDLGIRPSPIEKLLIASPQESADRIRQILDGKAGPSRDIAALNAAAALIVADKAGGLSSGFKLACESIDTGAAKRALGALVAISNGG
jgi:anthranilate phosphoribosyltransferase